MVMLLFSQRGWTDKWGRDPVLIPRPQQRGLDIFFYAETIPVTCLILVGSTTLEVKKNTLSNRAASPDLLKPEVREMDSNINWRNLFSKLTEVLYKQ